MKCETRLLIKEFISKELHASKHGLLFIYIIYAYFTRKPNMPKNRTFLLKNINSQRVQCAVKILRKADM